MDDDEFRNEEHALMMMVVMVVCRAVGRRFSVRMISMRSVGAVRFHHLEIHVARNQLIHAMRRVRNAKQRLGLVRETQFVLDLVVGRECVVDRRYRWKRGEWVFVRVDRIDDVVLRLSGPTIGREDDGRGIEILGVEEVGIFQGVALQVHRLDE